MKVASAFLLAALVCLWPRISFGANATSLKLPAGADVAIVMFEDMECPACAADYPVILKVAEVEHVPVLLYDFPLPQHPWAFDAAINAHFFDDKAKKLGDDFRAYIYSKQKEITAANFREYVETFASYNGVSMPASVDPGGKFRAAVMVDIGVGEQVELTKTPTIFVIGRGETSTPFIEVTSIQRLAKDVQEMRAKNASVVKSKIQ